MHHKLIDSMYWNWIDNAFVLLGFFCRRHVQEGRKKAGNDIRLRSFDLTGVLMSFTEEELEERLDHVCGSDAAVICGISPYNNKIALWQEKTRQIKPKDISDKPAVKAGKLLESAVRKWFTLETGIKVVVDRRLLKHESIEYMAGHIDGWVGTDAIFEAKTSAYDYGWGEQGDNTIPDHYLCQVAHYMAVCDVSKAYVAVLIRGNDFRHYIIERNQKLEEMLIRTQAEFWNCVKKNIAPTPTSGDEVISLHGYRSISESMVADGEINELLISLKDLRLNEANIAKNKKAIEDKIKVFMGEKDTLLDQNGKIAITWKGTASSKRFDANAFREENKDEYSKYIREVSSSRRFLIKQSEGL